MNAILYRINLGMNDKAYLSWNLCTSIEYKLLNTNQKIKNNVHFIRSKMDFRILCMELLYNIKQNLLVDFDMNLIQFIFKFRC